MFLTGFTPNLVILSLHLKEEWRWKAIQNHIFSIGQTSTCKTLEHFGIDVKKQHTASWMLNFFCNLRFVQWNGISSNTFWNSFLVNDHQQCIFDGPWCHVRALKWSVFLITERLVAFTSKHLLEWDMDICVPTHQHKMNTSEMLAQSLIHSITPWFEKDGLITRDNFRDTSKYPYKSFPF